MQRYREYPQQIYAGGLSVNLSTNVSTQSKILKKDTNNFLDGFSVTDIILATSLAIAFVTFLTLSKIAIVS